MPIIVGNMSFSYSTKSRIGGPRRNLDLRHQGSLHIDQGQLVCLTGPQCGGKATLLKILGGEILPVLRGDKETFFLPSHLRVLHVHKPFFFHGTLLENLVYGVHEGNDDQRVRRVVAICRHLGIPEDCLRHLEFNDEHLWPDVFSETQCQILSIARALIANPEVLCIHRPTELFDEAGRMKVAKSLRMFVDRKGLESTNTSSHYKRPRTCIATTSQPVLQGLAHRIFHVCLQTGIREVPVNGVEAGLPSKSLALWPKSPRAEGASDRSKTLPPRHSDNSGAQRPRVPVTDDIRRSFFIDTPGPTGKVSLQL